MLYLHYWFDDYVKSAGDGNADMYTNFLKTKNGIGYSKYFGKNGIATQEYNQRLKQMQSDWGFAYDDEFERVIHFLMDDDNTRSEIFKDQAPTNISTLGMLRESANDIDPEEIATIVDNFLKALQDAVQNMYAKIEGKPWEEFKDKVVREYAETKGGLTGSALKQAIISDFLTHEGLVNLNLTTSTSNAANQAGLQTALRNISLLLDALPEYGTSGNSILGSMNYSSRNNSGITKDGLGTLYKIAEKLQGLFNNIVGQGGELAWKVAEQTGLEKMISKGNMPLLSGDAFISTEVIGGRQMTITRSGKKDSNLESDIEKKIEKKKKSVSKGDVQVTIADNKVLITYGVSVKTYSFNTKTGAKNVGLVDSTPFLTAAQKLFEEDNGWRYMINLAGGNPGSSNSSSEKGYSLTDLNNRWDALVKEVVARNFIDVIAGVATQYGPTTLYLVINGQIIPITDILENLSNNVLDFSSRLINSNGLSLKRKTMMDMNTWIYYNNQAQKNRYTDISNEAALLRSSTAGTAIMQHLNQQKLVVSLTQLQNILK